MPAYGLIPDSPFLYWGKKSLSRGKPRGRPRRSGGGGSSSSFSFIFKDLVIYKPVLTFELVNRRGMTGRYLHRVAKKIVVDAKSQVGVKTGKLQRSIQITHIPLTTGASVHIGSKVKYAYLHHEGSKPHIITPKGPDVLRFRSKGVLVHTRLVRHPGTKPNRFLSDQLAKHIR
jgi:hypothetical protein